MKLLWKLNTLLIIINLVISANYELGFDQDIILNENMTSFIEKNVRKSETNKSVKYILNVKQNKNLDKKNIKKHSKYEKCKIKTGSLNYVLKHPKKNKFTI